MRTQYLDKTPVVASQSVWQELSPQREPPPGVDYREYLCCLGNTAWSCVEVSCAPVDPFAGQRKFSPRRNHGMVVLEGKLFVMGGRSRSFEGMDADTELHGGVTGYEGGTREGVHLMSDVWSSVDGETWVLENPGCWVAQPDLIDMPGRLDQACRTTEGCNQKRYGNTRCAALTCVCNLWSPREGMGVAAFDNNLYIFGGSTFVTKHKCGKFACGGGIRKYLNDVWVSPDAGTTWLQLLQEAPWKPRRDFAVFIFQSLLFVMGGIHASSDEYSSHETLDDIWYTNDMEFWLQNETSAAWSPRMNMGFTTTGSNIWVVGGQEMLPPIPSPSPVVGSALVDRAEKAAHKVTVLVQPSPSPYVDPRPGETLVGERFVTKSDIWNFDLRRPGRGWVQEHEAPQVSHDYVNTGTTWGEGAARNTFNLTDRELLSLRRAGINTVQDLLDIDSRRVVLLSDAENDRRYVRNLCGMRRWAQAALIACRYTPRDYDGQFVKYLRVQEDAAEAVYEREVEVIDVDDGPCDGLPGAFDADTADVVCRTELPARHSPFVGVLGFKLVVGGGYAVDDKSGMADVWYRDGTPPQTQIKTAPASGTFQTLIDWTVTEPARTEYRLWQLPGALDADSDSASLVRDWTLTDPPLEMDSFLANGMWRIQLRSVDGAGNRDVVAVEGVNIHSWEYVAPIPWLWIILGALIVLILLVVWTVYYRRRRRLRLMRKHAKKRMERKMRGIAKGDISTFSNSVNDKKKENKKAKRITKADKAKQKSAQEEAQSPGASVADSKSVASRRTGKTQRSKSSLKTRKSGDSKDTPKSRSSSKGRAPPKSKSAKKKKS
mgnify:CR=1 FL=1